MNVFASKVRGKIVIPGRVVFGGGQPKFRYFPRFHRWGNRLSVFWLGVELVFIFN